MALAPPYLFTLGLPEESSDPGGDVLNFWTCFFLDDMPGLASLSGGDRCGMGL